MRRSTQSSPARRWSTLGVACVLALGVVACSSDDSGDATSETTPERPLRILVANDDGYDSDGIDALVEGLYTLADVEIAVAAPLEERSATGATTTPGGVEATEVETISGHEAYAVDGYPADSVNWAVDGGIEWTPDVVVTGINEGQNIGVLVNISGTVNSALAASAAGIPSLAVSLGLGWEDYTVPVDLAVEWVDENRDALLDGDLPAVTYSINVPPCDVVKELVEVPVDKTIELSGAEVDCASTLEDPASDVEGFLNGFAVISLVDPIPEDELHVLEVTPSEDADAPVEEPAG